ncbi:MAG: ABC transporter permease [Planctomycetota bacterium]|nr:ABC transporter permease [Planctomycetota bacterium]
MTTYILKRLLLMPLMVLGITLVSFCVIILAPGTSGKGGGSGDVRSGKLTQQQLEVMQRTFHVGKPIYLRYLYWLGVLQPEATQAELVEARRKLAGVREQEAFLEDRVEDERRYRAYVAHLDRTLLGSRDPASPATPDPDLQKTIEEIEVDARVPLRGMLFLDFGMSVTTTSVSVWQKIKEALPVTLAMNLIVVIVIYLSSLPIGIHSATHQNTFSDKSTTVLLFVLYSLPSFWVSILMIKLMVSLPDYLRLPFQGIFPAGAEEMATLPLLWACTKHLALPVAAQCYGSLALLSRFMRASMLDVIRSDFVRTARAKGCRETTVIYRHALRNSLIPIVTLLGGLLPGLLGGSVIIETIFGIPGMGYLGYNAVLTRDYTVLMALFTASAVLTLLGILVSDILYVLVDPRISFEKGR